MMAKKGTPKDESAVSFVRLENANMIKLSLKQLAKLYTKYANKILEIKNIKDQKTELRKELFEQLNKIEDDYKELLKQLPKQPKMPQAKIKKTPYPKEKVPIIEYETGDTFSNLRREFERIREELERIR
jgi:hypothetical protein